MPSIDLGTVRVGEFRCHPDDPLWTGVNWIGPEPHVVFPRMPVRIRQAGADEFVTTRNHVVVYAARRRVPPAAHRRQRRQLLLPRAVRASSPSSSVPRTSARGLADVSARPVPAAPPVHGSAPQRPTAIPSISRSGRSSSPRPRSPRGCSRRGPRRRHRTCWPSPNARRSCSPSSTPERTGSATSPRCSASRRTTSPAASGPPPAGRCTATGPACGCARSWTCSSTRPPISPPSPARRASPTTATSRRPSTASSGSPRPPPARTSLHDGDFDFWVGNWDVTDPSDGSTGRNRSGASSAARCSRRASPFPDPDGKPYRGRSHTVHVDGRGWCQTWVDTTGLYLDFVGDVSTT